MDCEVRLGPSPDLMALPGVPEAVRLAIQVRPLLKWVLLSCMGVSFWFPSVRLGGGAAGHPGEADPAVFLLSCNFWGLRRQKRCVVGGAGWPSRSGLCLIGFFFNVWVLRFAVRLLGQGAVWLAIQAKLCFGVFFNLLDFVCFDEGCGVGWQLSCL